MPKMKTHKGAAKRFSLTKRGKIKKKKAGLSHILTSKSRKRKRSLRRGALIHDADVNRVKRMLNQ